MIGIYALEGLNLSPAIGVLAPNNHQNYRNKVTLVNEIYIVSNFQRSEISSACLSVNTTLLLGASKKN